MNKTWRFVKKVWFGIFNFPYLYSLSEFNVLFWLNDQHRKRTVLWSFLCIVLNLAPFLVSVTIAYLTDPTNLLCFINNGSLPIIAFGILTTNAVYLIENLSTDREAYSNLKNITLICSLIAVFITGFLYIAQSNFLDSFNHQELRISLFVSIILLILSISLGKKMFLLQNKLISLFEERFKEQMDNLQVVPNDSDIKF